jgi:Mlc titration factor MtfA (ptsG expression regulator)
MSGLLRPLQRWLRRGQKPVPFPAAWAAIIDQRVPLARALPEADRQELEQLVVAFLDEKTFEGAGGLTITDEIRVTIAAHACLLLLHRDNDVYPDLDTVLVYPSTYVAPDKRRDGMVVVEERSVRLGESWHRGLVVLAWDAVLGAAEAPESGHNVVLHEFAHQLDAEDGLVDGAPDLGTRARYVTWARVLGAEYTDLTERIRAGLGADIDAYGATSPPEFFAVVTEMFFGKPVALRARHPELYAVLADFYQQDPASLATD